MEKTLTLQSLSDSRIIIIIIIIIMNPMYFDVDTDIERETESLFLPSIRYITET